VPAVDGHIAFPPVLIGTTIDCPHCRATIRLPSAPQAPPETAALRIVPTPATSGGATEIGFEPVSDIGSASAQPVISKGLHTAGVVVLTVLLTGFALYDIRYLGLLPVVVLGASIFICWMAGNKALEQEALPMVPAAAVRETSR